MRIISQTEAAKILGISRQAISYALRRGHITGFDISGVWYCDKFSVARYGLQRQLKGNDGEQLQDWMASWSEEEKERFHISSPQVAKGRTENHP